MRTGDKGVTRALSSASRVVIIGGGVIGCSVAYHLTQRGWNDIVLLEKESITAGTTWHAAGLIATSGFTTETSLELAKYTRALYDRLEDETGQSTGFRRVGLLQLATNEGILEDLRRKASFNKFMGVESVELGPADVKALWPLARTDDVLAGFFAENDGRANPVDVTMSLARAARLGGATICEGVQVTGIAQKNGFETARGIKRHVLHDRLSDAGAFFVQSAGWEIADWYAPGGKKAEVDNYTWGRPNYFEWSAEEHRAVLPGVVSWEKR